MGTYNGALKNLKAGSILVNHNDDPNFPQEGNQYEGKIHGRLVFHHFGEHPSSLKSSHNVVFGGFAIKNNEEIVFNSNTLN